MGRKQTSKGAKSGGGGGGGKGKGKVKNKGKNFQYGDDKTLRKALANWGLQIVKVGADGNCLFRSFAEAHCGDQEAHHEYRKACCEFLVDQRDIYENFIHIDHSASARSAFEDGEDAWSSFEDYIEAMREDRCWGSQVELSAMCSRYDVCAMVFRGDGNYYELTGFASEPKDPADQRCLMISHHDDVHFNTIALEGQGSEPITLLAVRQLLLGARAKELDKRPPAQPKQNWEEGEEEAVAEEEEEEEEDENDAGAAGKEEEREKVRPRTKAERRRLKQREKEEADRAKREKRRGEQEAGEKQSNSTGGVGVELDGLPDIKVIQL